MASLVLLAALCAPALAGCAKQVVLQEPPGSSAAQLARRRIGALHVPRP